MVQLQFPLLELFYIRRIIFNSKNYFIFILSSTMIKIGIPLIILALMVVVCLSLTTTTTRKTTVKSLTTSPRASTKVKATTALSKNSKAIQTTTSNVKKITSTTKKGSVVKKATTKKSVTTKRPKETTTQIPIIRQTTEDLKEIFSNLYRRESRIRTSMKKETLKLQTALKKTPAIPKLQTTINEIIDIYGSVVSISNFASNRPPPPESDGTVCGEVANKIATTENIFDNFESVQSCLDMNSTYLQNLIDTMKNDLNTYKDAIPPAADFQQRIGGGNGIVKDLKEYIKLLNEAGTTVQGLNANLKSYNNANCGDFITTVKYIQNKVATDQASKCQITNNTDVCGTFLKFDLNADPDSPTSPRILGVVGGINFDNTPQYVGYGDSGCLRPPQNPCPGFISLDSSSLAVGTYMSCGSGIRYGGDNAYFLKNHKNLRWIDSNNQDMLTQWEAIRIVGKTWSFMVGRIMYEGDYRMGKVNYNNDIYGFYMIDENGNEIFFATGFQILTCTSCKNGGAGRYCCPNGK